MGGCCVWDVFREFLNRVFAGPLAGVGGGLQKPHVKSQNPGRMQSGQNSVSHCAYCVWHISALASLHGTVLFHTQVGMGVGIGDGPVGIGVGGYDGAGVGTDVGSGHARGAPPISAAE